MTTTEKLNHIVETDGVESWFEMEGVEVVAVAKAYIPSTWLPAGHHARGKKFEVRQQVLNIRFSRQTPESAARARACDMVRRALYLVINDGIDEYERRLAAEQPGILAQGETP